jgi:phosphatidylinositol N-acetylglucosaminyltransferase subunit A
MSAFLVAQFLSMPYSIAMVTDFFYPGLGGVESHIYQLSQCLIKLGYKVVVITHYRNNRHGVKYMSNGLKVYYLPFTPMYDQCTLPTIWNMMPLSRDIFIRESIEIVHSHQATSNTTHEVITHAKAMGLATVYTDHSLFGFGDAASININKILKMYLVQVNHSIAVSHTNKENLILRAAVDPLRVSVIPNAVDASRFTPTEGAKHIVPEIISVVVLSRLTYRKGIDLLVDIIPSITRKYKNVNFVIGGDGPKRLELEQMIERNQIHDRVELLGRVEHDKVREVMVKGHIFLNTSLTEAFCIAIVEAACCGLAVVSTDVGGVPEVLPPHLIRLSNPKVEPLLTALESAIDEVAVHGIDPWSIHNQVNRIYNWFDVAKRTIVVYDKVMKEPKSTLKERILGSFTSGPVVGFIFGLITTSNHLFFKFLEWLIPEETIEKFPNFSLEKWEGLSA